MRSPHAKNRQARLVWAGVLTATVLCATGACAVVPAGPAPAITTTQTVQATPEPSPTPSSTPEGREDVTRVRYLYVLVALGTTDHVEAAAEQSRAAAQDAVAALEESLRGDYELSIDDGGVVKVPLTKSELRTFRESIDDEARHDGLMGLDLYREKLGLALDSIGHEALEGYDGVVATVLLASVGELKFLERYSWKKSVLVGVMISLTTWVIFQFILGVPLPAGIFAWLLVR